MPNKSFELKHTPKLISKPDSKVYIIEAEIKDIINEIDFPVPIMSVKIQFQLSSPCPDQFFQICLPLDDF